MEYLREFAKQLRGGLFLLLVLHNILLIGSWVLLDSILGLQGTALTISICGIGIVLLFVLTIAATHFIAQPTNLISQAVFHVAPISTAPTPTPDPTQAYFAKELVANLIHQIYELATTASQESQISATKAHMESDSIANSLPLPLLLLSADQSILFANDAAGKYLGFTTPELKGQNIYSALDMSFPSNQTYDSWLADVRQNNATATSSWERVRLNPTDNRPYRLFDLAAYYSKDNSEGIESMLVLFDHTKQYSQDDQAVSFIALSVHELRTPLTLLRGYIEAFEDEFAGKLEPELNDFMFKMSASAQQLTAFVNNILNVARVDDDQLVLQLHEEQWGDVIRLAANNVALRAKVRGITLEYSIAPNLPTVGADRVSVMEVINNLVDNAIKYSGQSKTIRISTYLNSEGLVETAVEDHGMGIPANIIQHLFTKFYRDHHNRAQIGGTGLGLYLSKAIVTAHGGNIWVKSKEGEGSTFGFTLVPYTQMSEELKNSENKDITRSAHGWIKNHSLYRR